MADSRDALEEAAIADESQANVVKSFVDFLKQHREIFHKGKEMLETLMDMESSETSDIQNSDLSREDEQHIPEKRKEANKDKRIMQLERELKEKTLENEKLSKEKEESISSWRKDYCKLQEEFKSSTDKYLKEIDATSKEKTELKERISSLQNEQTSRDLEMVPINSNNDEQTQECKDRNEDLAQQIRTKEDQVKEYEAKCNKLTEENEGLLANKDEELKGIKTRFSEYKKKWKVSMEEKDEELKKMKIRLACLSEKQVQRDQRRVEDTTSSNRPSEVEKDFNAFFDDERMDACEKMKEVYGSEEESGVRIFYPRLACMIFETAYEEMKETKEAVLTLFKVISKSMIDLAPTMGAEYALKAKGSLLPYNISFNITTYRPELEHPIDVFDALALSLKESARECDLESFKRSVKRKIKEKWLQWLTKEKSCRFSHSDYLLAQLNDYIKACIRLTWRMVTQVPPMQLEYQSSTLKDIHKYLRYHNSPEMCSSRPTTEGQATEEELEIAYYLWPALLDGGGKLIRAGEVVCKVK